VISTVVFGMIDSRELLRLYRVHALRFWIARSRIVGLLSRVSAGW